MRTYEQHKQDVLNKVKKLRFRRRMTALAVGAGAAVLALVLFFPFQPPSVRQYRSSPYYALIQSLNSVQNKPQYKNYFDLLSSRLFNMGGAVPDTPNTGGTSVEEAPGIYQEITDNQVAGITEPDMIKRTDRYIFYLDSDGLCVYPIAQENTRLLGHYSFADLKNMLSVSYSREMDMYLSQDCTRVTVLLNGYGDLLDPGRKQDLTCVLSLDVSDPENIREAGRIYLTGSCRASRMADGKLLLMLNQFIDSRCDYDRPETFLPGYGLPGQMEYLPGEDVIAPQNPDNSRYVVVSVLDEKSLSVLDSMALLSYHWESYVSRENICITRSFTETPGASLSRRMTEIVCIGYDEAGKLTHKGSVTLEGTVKNQYSMDEYNGILRVVTSTSQITLERYATSFGGTFLRETAKNVNIYCVSLSDFSIAASVKGFAPEGEAAESVRFDGDAAYVCTAEVITVTDPVYYFDLSDLGNITWKDTGTIDGYSSSLVNFGDHLMGIGFGADRTLKIEAYRETETGVESVAAYERACDFSWEYRSYYIDRENRMIGLGIYDYEEREAPERYILLQFDGSGWNVLADEALNGSSYFQRGVVIEDWLYLFGTGEQKTVKLN